MVVAGLLYEPQAAVSARMIARLVLRILGKVHRLLNVKMPVSHSPTTHQINVHFRVAERTVAAVARHHTLGALLRRNLRNQIDAPVLVHQTRAVLEAYVAVVLLFEHLRGSEQIISIL